MTYREMNEAKKEKARLKQEAGLISGRFPDVSSIVVDMKHHKKGISATLLSRTLNFSPDSFAYFQIECLNKDCKDCGGEFDFEKIVSLMVRNRALSKEGELGCDGNGITSGHINISYKVTIQYN